LGVVRPEVGIERIQDDSVDVRCDAVGSGKSNSL
jgi:hypothetical protein